MCDGANAQNINVPQSLNIFIDSDLRLSGASMFSLLLNAGRVRNKN